MGFFLHSTDDGHIPSIEYLPCGAITPKAGMALTQSSGNLVIATSTTAPAYISMIERSSACKAGEPIPVIRVGHDMVFDTVASAAMTEVKCGDRVTLHASDGMQVTATTTGGVAEVIEMDGTAVGDHVRVRF